MKVPYNFKVRSYECDSYNHVNNAVYVNYLELGRMEFLNKIGFDYEGIVEKGFFLYVTHIDIFYKASAHLNDELTIETESVKLGAVTGDFHQIIKKADGTVCVEATVSWCSVSKETGRPVKIPKEYVVEGLLPPKA